MGKESLSQLTVANPINADRDAALSHWIGSSFGRLLQLRGEGHEDLQPRVKIESVWAALGDRAAPVTIVRWREETRADLVA